MVFLVSFGFLCAICAALSYLQRRSASHAETAARDPENKPETPVNPSADSSSGSAFQRFQRLYLAVFLLMMAILGGNPTAAGDWLQGPYVYALYQLYNFDQSQIAVLFVAGFLSSAVLGTAIGAVADTLQVRVPPGSGRKRMSLAFCIIYSISCLTKLSPNFWILMGGRILAGIATSLLFSVFEAWLVCEHGRLGFDPALLSHTFSWSTWGNGLVAILSGVAANLVADWFGLVAPFMLAIVTFAIGGAVIWLTWSENYGQQTNTNWFASLKTGMDVCRNDRAILSLGLIQSLFEAAMYSFVFMWTPALQRGLVVGDELTLPFGWIFSSFMVAVMIGSMVFDSLMSRTTAETIAPRLYLVSAVSLMVPMVVEDRAIVFWSFVVFEITCGLHFPLISTLRSRYIPEESRSAVLNLVRIPLNLIVVVILLKVASMAVSTVFAICGVLLLTSAVLAQNVKQRAAAAPLIPAPGSSWVAGTSH